MSGERGREGWRSTLCALGLAALPFLFFWPLALGRQAFAEGDLFNYYYPLIRIFREQWTEGRVPLWNPYIFGGTPLLAQMQGGVFYPLNFLLLLVRPDWLACSYSLLLHYALAGVFTFLYARGLPAPANAPGTLSRPAAVLAALVFMFGAFGMSHLGHVGLVRTVPWLPLILWSYDGWRIHASGRRLAIGGIAVGLMLLAGHPQVPLYTLMVTASYAAVLSAATSDRGERRRGLVGLVLIVGSGAALAAVQLLPTAVLVREYLRPEAGGYGYFANGSASLYHLANMFFPLLIPSDLAELPGYVGIAPLAFATVGVFAAWRSRSRPFLYFAVLAAVALILVLGSNTPFYRVLYYVPLYNLFTVPARNWFEFNFAMAVLSAYGLDAVRRPENTVARRWLPGALAALVLTAAAAAVFAMWLGLTAEYDPPASYLARFWAYYAIRDQLPVWGASLLLLGIAAGSSRAAASAVYAGALALLVSLDLFNFGGWIYGRYTPSVYDPPESLRFLAREPRGFRTLTLGETNSMDEIREAFAPNYSVALRMESLNGFDSLMLNQIDQASAHVMPTYGLVTNEEGYRGRQFERYMDLLGARFVLVPGHETRTLDPQRYREVFRNANVGIHRNDQALPRFFVVFEARPATFAQSIAALESGRFGAESFEPRNLALVEVASPPTRVPSAPGGEAAIAVCEGKLELLSFEVAEDMLALRWRLREPTRDRYVLSLEWLDDAGQGVGRIEQPVGARAVWGSHPTGEWRAGEVVQDLVTLPRAATSRLAAHLSLSSSGEGRCRMASASLTRDARGRLVLPISASASSRVQVEILSMSPGEAKLRVDSPADGVLIHGSNMSSGWTAMVDDVSVPVYRADGLVQAIPIARGRHEVWFRYRPLSVALGAAISLLTASFLAAVILRPAWLEAVFRHD